MFGEIFAGFIMTMVLFYLFGCIATFMYRVCKKEPEDDERTEATRMKRSIRMNFAKDVEKDVEIPAEND